MQFYSLLPELPYVKLMLRATIALVILLGFWWPVSLFAQDSGESENGPGGPGREGSQWSVGIASISTQKPFKDIDLDTIAFPFITFENKYFRWFGPTLNFKLPGIEFSDSQQLSFNIAVEYNFGGYDEDEAKSTPILTGMSKRNGGVWAGAKMEWQNPIVDLNAEWMADVSGNSEGQRFSIGIEKTWMFGQHVMLTPRLTAVNLDDKYVDYYYGVRSEEARSGRPEYLGDSMVNLKFALRTAYMFDMKQSIFIEIGATTLGDEIKNSPLVGSSTETSAFLVYMYSF